MKPHYKRLTVRLTVESLEERSLLSSGMTVQGAMGPVMMGPVMGTPAQSTPMQQQTHHRMMVRSAILSNLTAQPTQSISTVPANGDQNPYGVAFVPQGFARGGPLHPGDVLVSNFNNSSNLQGKGTTILQVTPSGQTSTFFHGAPTLGLTTALGVLQRGLVIVGSVPTSDGTNVQPPGSLLILNRHGTVVTTLSDPKLLAGPWDLTVNDEGNRAQVFVANVLNGTVSRIDLRIPAHGNAVHVQSITQIASGYAFRTDPMALILGPTGLAFDARKGILYVASTADNAIFAIPGAARTRMSAGTGRMVFQNPHLRGPLGLVLTPNGDLIAANGDAVNADPLNKQTSELVEFTRKGQFVSQFALDPKGDAAFGIALASSWREVRFAAVNDNTNMLELWTFRS